MKAVNSDAYAALFIASRPDFWDVVHHKHNFHFHLCYKKELTLSAIKRWLVIFITQWPDQL